MAQRKKNIYSTSELSLLKREIVGIIDYLQSLDLNSIQDKIEWRTVGAGGLLPGVISSQEEIIETVIGEIKRSTDIIMAVFEVEGMTDILQTQIDITLQKLSEVQEYYFQQLPKDIEPRILKIPAGFDRNNNPKIVTVIAATQEKQIKIRGRITKNIMEVIPKVDIIKTYNNSSVRGGAEATPAMKRFERRRAQQLELKNE